MASPSRFCRLRRIVLALLSVFVVLKGAHWVMWFVHTRQEIAVLQRMGFGRDCAMCDDDGYVWALSLDDTDSVSDEVLGCLRELAHLRRLHITGRGFTDQGLASLTGLTRLEEVYLRVPSDAIWARQEILTDEGLSYLRGLESLRRLRYVGGSVTDAGMRHLEGLHNLEDLAVSCREATDDGLKSLAKLDRLESLTLLNGPGMTGEGLVALPDPSRLRELLLKNVTDGGMRTIARFRNLRDLSIAGPRLGVDGLKDLLVFSDLEKLTIAGASVDNRVLETVVGKITGLKELTIYDCPIRGDALKHLHRLKELEVLSVCGAGLDDASAPYLEEFPKLRHLWLERTSITSASLPHLLRVRTLEEVFVPFSIRMTPERRRELREALPRLRELWTADGMVEFGVRKEK